MMPGVSMHTRVFLRILHSLREQFKIIEVDTAETISRNNGKLEAVLHHEHDTYDITVILSRRVE